MAKWKVLVAVMLVVIVTITAFATLIIPSTAVVFTGRISLQSTGQYTYVNNNTTYTANYVDLYFNYSLPVHLNPDRLNITLERNGGFVEPFYVDPSNKTNVTLNSLNLTFSFNQYPHIVTTFKINGMPTLSTAYHGEIYNPNGVKVGQTPVYTYENGIPFANTWIGGDSYVQSGAIINLSLGNLPLTGLTFTVHCDGAYGASNLNI